MTYGLLEEPLIAKDIESLEQISSLLHDEVVEVERIVHTPKKGNLLLPVRRQFHGAEETVIESGTLETVYEKDWMRSEIEIRHVLDWEKIDDHGIEDYTVNELEFDGKQLMFYFCEELRIRVRISQLEMEVRDKGFRGRARISRWRGGAESSSSKIY